MKLGQLKKYAGRNLMNIPGWRTKRKIVVIESDDWGSIRMPSKEVYSRLLEEGYHPDTDFYLQYDCIESEEDLDKLFDVLGSVGGKDGRPVKLTANTVMGNPDFKKIRQSGFSNYYFEHFTATYTRYPQHGNVFALWKSGMERGIFHPQFHGREHLNVDRWMLGLQNGNALLHKAFENEMISLCSPQNEMRFDFMEGLDYFNEQERTGKKAVIQEGLALFNETFGYASKSFIANCYIWDDIAEQALKENGVLYLQGILNQLVPDNTNGVHSFYTKKHFTGQKNHLGQRYLMRNVFFEPGLNKNKTGIIADCLQRIKIAFTWNKPAIIGSHRLNYIGSIESNNRETNLQLLKTLLNEIVKTWPDVEFMSSDEVGDLINKPKGS